MTHTTYGAFVRSLRERHQLSQQAVADQLGVSRSTYLAIERGSKALSLDEAEALSSLYGIGVTEILEGRTADETMYKEMILAYLRAAAADGRKVKKTKLAKLLYFADFAWFYEHLDSMSGMKYRRIQFGPVPNEYFAALESLEEEGRISIAKKQHEDGHDMYEVEEVSGSRRTPLERVSKEQLALMQKIWKKWADAPTSQIVRFTHEQLPYKLSFDKSVIPYELITQESPDHVY